MAKTRRTSAPEFPSPAVTPETAQVKDFAEGRPATTPRSSRTVARQARPEGSAAGATRKSRATTDAIAAAFRGRYLVMNIVDSGVRGRRS